jgi:hypothetical protein
MPLAVQPTVNDLFCIGFRICRRAPGIPMDILRRRHGRAKIYTFYPIGKSLPSRRKLLRIMFLNSGIGHVLGLAGRQEIQRVAPRNRRLPVFAAHFIGILLDQIVDFLLKISRGRCGRPLWGWPPSGFVPAQIVTDGLQLRVSTLLVIPVFRIRACLVGFVEHLDRTRGRLGWRGSVRSRRRMWNFRRLINRCNGCHVNLRARCPGNICRDPCGVMVSMRNGWPTSGDPCGGMVSMRNGWPTSRDPGRLTGRGPGRFKSGNGVC